MAYWLAHLPGDFKTQTRQESFVWCKNLALNTVYQLWLVDHFNVSLVSIWDVKETLSNILLMSALTHWLDDNLLKKANLLNKTS